MMRDNVPSPGKTLAVTAEKWGRPIRDSVNRVFGVIVPSPTFETAFSPYEFTQLSSKPGSQDVHKQHCQRAAWLLCNMWLLARRAGSIEHDATLREAEEWFLGDKDSCLLCDALADDVSDLIPELRSIDVRSRNFLELIPYALDPHGLATRRTVMRDASTEAIRAHKKSTGVVYTPADVAEYMVRAVIHNVTSHKQVRFLDPACGTGVYLLAALARLRPFFPTGLTCISQCLYGVDISAIAVESCAFSLLHNCVSDSLPLGTQPVSAWRTIRSNLAVADFLELEPCRAKDSGAVSDRGSQFKEGFRSGQMDWSSNTRRYGGRAQSVYDLFPQLTCGFNSIATNPPYAAIGERAIDEDYRSRFESLRAGGSAKTNMYVPFIENSLGIVSQCGGKASLVVPLSLSFGQATSIKRLRSLIQDFGGASYFAFFDRTPDALFGDDVKQRCCIATFESSPKTSNAIYSTSLTRWTSRTRANLFTSLGYTRVDGVDIERLIPKVGSSEEISLYRTLYSCDLRIGSILESIQSTQLNDLTDAENTLSINTTAYNWIAVAREAPGKISNQELTTASPVHMLSFHEGQCADSAFGFLASGLIYWLWRVQGDGFHVTRRFILDIPVCSALLEPEIRVQLAEMGRSYWAEMKNNIVISRNRGRSSVSFNPKTGSETRYKLDLVLVRAFGIRDSFAEWLQHFSEETAIVDREDTRRVALYTT